MPHDLTVQGKLLNAYESNMANLEARLQHLESTLEEKVCQPFCYHGNYQLNDLEINANTMLS